MKRLQKIACLLVALFYISSLTAQTDKSAELPVFTVDASRHLGGFKAFNGVNGGPRTTMGRYDNSEYFNAFKPPFVRIHDAPLAADEAVDIHYIFPDFDADENDPANYNFKKTDLYLKAILDCGSQVLFRLGETIEGGDPEKYPKFHVHPPADYNKWARICCNIIRHYNMGWADGFKWNIQYWEIWNEFNSHPECWSGTPLQYFQLYEVAAKAIKKLDLNLKVGGPALNTSINSEAGRNFLAYCRDKKLPLDFISWHGYASHPKKVIENIEEGITAVKEYGFTEAETINDEWNYMALPLWGMKDREYKYEKGFKKTRGPEGAAFTASVLGYIQNSELDISCYYSAYGSVFRFGLFDIFGLPQKPLYSFIAYNELVKCGTQIAAAGSNRETGLGITAATNDNTGMTAVIISNFDDENSRFILNMKNIPVNGNTYCSEYVIDENRSLDWDREQIFSSDDFQMVVELPKSSVRLLLFTPELRDKEPLVIFGKADKEADKKRLEEAYKSGRLKKEY